MSISTFTTLSLMALVIFLAIDYYRYRMDKRTFSQDVYRISLFWRGLVFALIFLWGYLTCHFFECY